MKTFRAKEGSGIRLITHQSSCEFSAAVGHRRERERTEDNSGREGICWAALKAPFFPFSALSASLSCSLSTEQPNRCRLFSGEGGAEKNLSLSLSFSPFFHPLTLFLSLYCPLVLSLLLILPLLTYFFPLSYFLCSLYLSLSGCEFGCVCACINGFTLSRRQNQICTKMWISYACLC